MKIIGIDIPKRRDVIIFIFRPSNGAASRRGGGAVKKEIRESRFSSSRRLKINGVLSQPVRQHLDFFQPK